MSHSISTLPEYFAAAGPAFGPGPAAAGGRGADGAVAFAPLPFGPAEGGGVVLAPEEGGDEDAPPLSSETIVLPCETLSPTFTATVLTMPSAGDGTSIVALSDSSVTSGSSALTAAPGSTSTSMTGTSRKSPMSGTLTSTIAIRCSLVLVAPRRGHGARSHQHIGLP